MAATLTLTHISLRPFPHMPEFEELLCRKPWRCSLRDQERSRSGGDRRYDFSGQLTVFDLAAESDHAPDAPSVLVFHTGLNA